MLRVDERHNQGVYLIDKFDEYFRTILKYSKGTFLDKRKGTQGVNTQILIYSKKLMETSEVFGYL